MRAYTHTVTPLHTGVTVFRAAGELRTDTMKRMLLEARTVLRDRYLFMQHLKKDKLAFAINFTLKHVQLPVRPRKCVYLETEQMELG